MCICDVVFVWRGGRGLCGGIARAGGRALWSWSACSPLAMESCTSLLSSYADSSDEEVNDGRSNVEGDAASSGQESRQPPAAAEATANPCDVEAVGEEAKTNDVVEGRTDETSEESGAGRRDGAERELEESAAAPCNAPAKGHDSSGREAAEAEGDGESGDGSKGELGDSVKLHSGDAMPTAIYEVRWRCIVCQQC